MSPEYEAALIHRMQGMTTPELISLAIQTHRVVLGLLDERKTVRRLLQEGNHEQALRHLRLEGSHQV